MQMQLFHTHTDIQGLRVDLKMNELPDNSSEQGGARFIVERDDYTSFRQC